MQSSRAMAMEALMRGQMSQARGEEIVLPDK